MQLEVEGACLSVEVAGERGPPVLLIQGVGVRGAGWRPQIEALQHVARLAWFDHRGIGRSSGAPVPIAQVAEDALAILDHLGWADAHLVGHSMGGVVAQEVALVAPERVRSLALLCTFARGRAAIQLSPRALLGQLQTRLGTQQMRRRAFFRLVADPQLHGGPDEEAHMAELEAVFGRALWALPPATMGQLRALVRFDRSAALPRLAGLPVLVLSGRADRIAVPEQGIALARALGVEPVLLDGGHAVVVSQAPEVNRHLEALWERADAEG